MGQKGPFAGGDGGGDDMFLHYYPIMLDLSYHTYDSIQQCQNKLQMLLMINALTSSKFLYTSQSQ